MCDNHYLFFDAFVIEVRRTLGRHLLTLLSRLLNKKAVAADVDRRRYLYRPLLSRDAFVASESRSLLDRLFGGKLAPLVSHFAQQRELSKQDIAELRHLVEDLDRD